MAAAAAAAENTTELMSKLNLDAKSKTRDAAEVTRKYGAVDRKDVPNVSSAPTERSLTPLLQEYVNSNMCYLPNGYQSPAYYYGGYDGSVNDWEDYPRYVNSDGVEIAPPGVYGDMYHGYGYAPYGPYPSTGSPVPTMGPNGQLYGPQHYQYPATYYQPQATQGAPYSQNQAPAPRGDISTSVAADQPTISVDIAKAKPVANGNANRQGGVAPPKSSQLNPSPNSNGSSGRGAQCGPHLSSGYQDPRFGYDGMQSPVSWFDPSAQRDGQHRRAGNGALPSAATYTSNSSSTRNQNLRPLPHLMGLDSRQASGMGSATPGLVNRMYPNNRIYAQCGNAFRTSMGYGSSLYDSRINGQWGVPVDSKFKPRGRGNGLYCYGNENSDSIGELSRGPRADRFKNPKVFTPPVTIAVKGQNLSNVEDSSVVPDKDQFNRSDFSEKYADAKFFIIKSYSEDDVHKSVKYNVWASTPNGNKKLDAAYQEAQEKSGGCPVFLLFSVNASGQFVGAAEMVGPVDFNKTVEYWQQDKWTGCFPVKWHIVKDIPNGILKHITLENNDNKPVTNSRDTQEVKLEQGLQILKLFKEHASKTSILDDFAFYESRQKAMQEKRAKQQQIQKQVVSVRPANALDDKARDVTIGNPRLQNPLEFVSILKKEAVAGGGLVERKPSVENGMSTVSGDGPKGVKPVVAEKPVATGIPNGC